MWKADYLHWKIYIGQWMAVGGWYRGPNIQGFFFFEFWKESSEGKLEPPRTSCGIGSPAGSTKVEPCRSNEAYCKSSSYMMSLAIDPDMMNEEVVGPRSRDSGHRYCFVCGT